MLRHAVSCRVITCITAKYDIGWNDITSLHYILSVSLLIALHSRCIMQSSPSSSHIPRLYVYLLHHLHPHLHLHLDLRPHLFRYLHQYESISISVAQEEISNIRKPGGAQQRIGAKLAQQIWQQLYDRF